MKKYLIVLFLAVSFNLFSQEKYALVIGNGSYDKDPLGNTVNDATDVSEEFVKLGYNVTTLLDANREKMETTVQNLSQTLTEDSMIVFYYAGHAAQLEGSNYLIPVNESISSESSLKYKGVNLDYILSEFKSSLCRTSIVILDSCRDNPYKDATRSNATRGLKVVSRAPVSSDSIKNSIVIYATADGQTADDGDGRNSPFTAAFLKHMTKENETIQDVMTYVTKDVVDSSNGKQYPQMANYSLEKIYLNKVDVIESVIVEKLGSIDVEVNNDGILYINDEEYETLNKNSLITINGLSVGTYSLRYVHDYGEENIDVEVENGEITPVVFNVEIIEDENFEIINSLKEEKAIVESKIKDAKHELDLLKKEFNTHVNYEKYRDKQKSRSNRSFLISIASYAGAGIAGYFTVENYLEYQGSNVSEDAELYRERTIGMVTVTAGAALFGLINSAISNYNKGKVNRYDTDKEFLLMRISRKRADLEKLNVQSNNIDRKLALYIK